MKTYRTLWITLIVLWAGLTATSFRDAPVADGGAFPTITPTVTPLIIPTATATPQGEGIVVTLGPGYPPPTSTVPGLYPTPPSNIQQAETPEAPGDNEGNPLITAAFIGLFIFLVVGVWMLFSRRGMNP